MTWVMSGFCGWAVALCVDTWKLPGTWGEMRIPGVWWAAPEGGAQGFALESDRSGSGPQLGPSHGTLEQPLTLSEPQALHL